MLFTAVTLSPFKPHSKHAVFGVQSAIYVKMHPFGHQKEPGDQKPLVCLQVWQSGRTDVDAANCTVEASLEITVGTCLRSLPSTSEMRGNAAALQRKFSSLLLRFFPKSSRSF